MAGAANKIKPSSTAPRPVCDGDCKEKTKRGGKAKKAARWQKSFVCAARIRAYKTGCIGEPAAGRRPISTAVRDVAIELQVVSALQRRLNE